MSDDPTSRQLVRTLLKSGVVDTKDLSQKTLLSKRRVQELVKEFYEEQSFRPQAVVKTTGTTVVYESPSVTHFISGSLKDFNARRKA
jgi:hypothetical protein